jgi:lauroyl/myristoyl acyltransferase
MAHMYRRPRNDMLHQALLYCRTHFGGVGFERYANLRPLVQSIRRGECLYYAPDQDPDHKGRDKYVFAPFFGVPAATYTALSRLVRMGNAVAIPCFTRQLPRGRGYEVIIDAPIPDYPGEDEREDARRVNEVIEKGVSMMPDQYLWSYRRFKTRPDNAPSPYHRT